MVVYRLLGSGVTDANGVASVSYTGAGAGEMDLVASTSNPITQSSLVSETYELLDCYFYDKGTTGTVNTNWINATSSNSSSSSNGTTFTKSTTGYLNIYANKADTSTSSQTDYTGAVKVEFDYVSSSGTVYTVFNDGTNNVIRNIASVLNPSENSHIVITYDGTIVRWYCDGTQKSSETVTLGTYSIGFILNNSTITFKDFKVYPI